MTSSVNKFCYKEWTDQIIFILFSLAGEVERLLREFRQNQELVRNIGAHYYQIIYPVQLRHHEKMGISTREVGAQKVTPYSLTGLEIISVVVIDLANKQFW